MTEKYIFDVDTGVDDAQALMLAMSRPEVEVLAITCVAGNCNLDQVCLNTLKVLHVCNRNEIPVYKGASKPLLGKGLVATHYHGNDGLGEADLDIQVSADQLQQKHAVSALVDLVNKFPGEITLVALAPLTNIALALKQDPDLGKKLKKFFVMGGNTEGKGNSMVCSEFNFGCDPDAAYVVLNEIGIYFTISPWEINLDTSTCQPWDWYDKWIETDTDKGRFLKAISKLSVHKQRNVRKLVGFRSCDLAAVAMVIDPSLILESTKVYATVEVKGQFTQGMMVVDWNGILGCSPNVAIVRKMDTERARVLYDAMLM